MLVKQIKTLTLLFLTFALTQAQAEEEKVVNLYNWADYVGPTTLSDFEKEYGIKINYDIYDTTEIVDAKLLAGRTGYDVVVHAGSYSARLIKIGVYQPLDKGRLSNLHHMDADIMKTLAYYDPGNLYSIPYMWGTTGVSFNIDMLRERVPGISLQNSDFFFKPEIVSHFADCGITVLDDVLSVIPMVMGYLGHDVNTITTNELKDVEGVMKSIRPFIKYFSSAKMLIDIPNKEVCLAMSWSGDYSVARSRAREAGIDINLGYAMPSGAIPMWIDGMFIPRDAPHPDNAHLLINYLMRPEVIAAASNLTGYANGNRSATALVDAEITADPAIYPDADVRSRLKPNLVFSPKVERPRSRTWTRIKSGL